MLTICWAAKGGSGTTAVAATLALATSRSTLLVDLAGDAATALGLADSDRPQLADWMESDATPARLAHLECPVTRQLALLPTTVAPDPGRHPSRWRALAEHLDHQRSDRDVVVDAGTGNPAAALVAVADRSLLVTRSCYLSLRRALRMSARPTGVVLVEEPGRALTRDDVEAALGVPVVATVLLDPKIARAIDSGLSVSRLPLACLSQLRAAS